MAYRIIAVCVLLAGVFWLFSGPSTGAEQGGYDVGTYVAAAVLGAYALYILSAYRGENLRIVYYLTVWAAIAGVLAIGYVFRDDMKSLTNRIATEFLPPGYVIPTDPQDTGQQAVRIRKQSDGHFAVRAEVDGITTRMLVDTGASTVVLSAADAQRAGIDIGALSFTVTVNTANGQTFAAPVRLRTIRIGSIIIQNVEGLVARPGNLDQSLLGMSFLERLRSYEISGEYLTLRL